MRMVFGFFRKQLLDVIEWTENEPGVLAFRFPMKDQEIQNGAQLTVRDTQIALFVNEGQLADLFEAGRHALATRNLPVLTNLKHWDKGFESPFKSDLYFFSTREQLDQRWGTTTPILVKDKNFGPIRLRAFGSYSYRIKNPRLFFQKVSGTQEVFRVEQLEGQLRAATLTHLAAFLGKNEIPFVDMAANQIEFSNYLKGALTEMFQSYGLELESFFVQSLSLPDELQGHLDKVASMKMLGDLRNYAQFQAADSISIAAGNSGGAAGAGASMGVGLAMSQAMAQSAGGAVATATEKPAATAEDPMATIKKLHDMMKDGIISSEEFEAKKAELMKRIT
ncbi:MAG: SPFH domain-containing protein [Bdellovibrionaceae bacterium]|nr:SPFH domain-containing protein [Pseudobdellovibrionaceae bacterium]